MNRMYKNRGGSGFVVACSIVAACSVDTSDVHFVPDEALSGAGVANLGGVLNKGGALNQAGDSIDGGEPSGGTPSTGGTTSKGGTTSTAGKPAGGSSSGGPNGGSPAGGGPNGGAGAGGAPPVAGYPCTSVRPGKLLADFDKLTSPLDTWKDPTLSLSLGFYTYPPEAPPNIKVGSGNLTVEARAVNQPAGFGLWLSPCADAKGAGFNALTFTVSGTWSKGSDMFLRVGIHSNATTFADPMLQSGGCVPPMGQDITFCRPAATEVKISPLGMMPPAGPIVLPFSSFRNGNPAVQLDATQIKSIEWGFIYLNGDPAFSATVEIDDVGFL
ncbi:MAG TPA: hypothetical protein VHP33_38525 [Polyangiaceae bacterium]|nr:hypothetical protein [Polyangiaceae bacterium]